MRLLLTNLNLKNLNPLKLRNTEICIVSASLGAKRYSNSSKSNPAKEISTSHKILSDLEQILRSGKAPKKFNFSKDIFDQHVATKPSSPALWFENDHSQQKWSFSSLQQESIRSAIFLRQVLNLPSLTSDLSPPNPSPHILTILSRIPEWWFLHLAAIRIGSVFSPGTTMLTAEDIRYRLEASNASLVITDEANMGKIDEAQNGLPPQIVKNLNKVVILKENSKHLKNGWIDYNKFIKEVEQRDISAFKNAETLGEDTAQSYFTSGTTGKPKMVAHSHVSYGIGHYTTVKMLDLKDSDVHWNISDPGWAKSSYSNFFAPWTVGCAVYIHQMERFEAKKVLKVLTEKEITTFCAPPTLYKSMVQESDPSMFKFKALRYSIGAGEPVSPEVVRVWKHKTGVTLDQAYGQTEMTAIDCQISVKDDSIGIPNGFMDLRILDDEGKECGPNVEGQVALKVKPTRPIGLFKGYLTKGPKGPEMDTEKNKSVFVGDFYLLGDRAYKDESGHLFIVGRADDVINSAGYRIGPTEIESVLQTHESVVESAAVASPDPHRNEVVKAFIVLTTDYQTRLKNDPTEEPKLVKEIQDYVKKHTAPYKYPRKVEFVEALPKTVSGKILRRELKRMEFEKHGKLKKP